MWALMRLQTAPALLLAVMAAQAATAEPTPPGDLFFTSDRNGDSEMKVLSQEIWVDAPIETVWHAWTTEEGLSFVSAKSNVRLEIGGPYEWFLDLEPDEHGRRGGEGAMVQAFLPPEMLAFSWTFPPSIPSLRNAEARTQVVVRFREVDGGTHVDLGQLGWQAGEDWDRGYEYFSRGWESVLKRLKARLEGGGETRGEDSPGGDTTGSSDG